jgi:excisionase family DNA binding protein
MTTKQTENLLTREAAAVYLNVSARTIDRYMGKGIIKPIKFGRAVRFKKADLDNPSRPHKPLPNIQTV